MAKQLLGKEVTAAMNEKLQQRVAVLKEKGVTPKLARIPLTCPMKRAPPPVLS